MALARVFSHRHTQTQTHRHRHRHRQTDRQTDRQTHTHTHTHVPLRKRISAGLPGWERDRSLRMRIMHRVHRCACAPLCYHGDFEKSQIRKSNHERNLKNHVHLPREEAVVLYFNIQRTAIDPSALSQCRVDRRGCGYISWQV